MQWILGTLAGVLLILLGRELRRLLQLDQHGPCRPVGLVPLDSAREAIYQAAALEMQAQTAILAVSLNDAMEERDAGHADISWQLVHLSRCAWERLAEVLIALFQTISKYTPAARFAVPVRSIAADRFRSAAMVDCLRMREWLDQFVFRYKQRFQIHIRVLRSAAETLTVRFAMTKSAAQRSPNCSSVLWDDLDVCFHDFDLVIKETLLAFRALLASLPEKELQDFAADLDGLIACGVRHVSGKQTFSQDSFLHEDRVPVATEPIQH
jgi:hypothetical protein